MKNDQSQDKYEEITRSLKEEKMKWEFDDFLKKTTQEDKMIPLVTKTKGGSIPKIFWMAASVILLLSAGFFFKYENANTISENDQLVQNEILKQKDTFQQDSNLAVNLINDTLKVKSTVLFLIPRQPSIKKRAILWIKFYQNAAASTEMHEKVMLKLQHRQKSKKKPKPLDMNPIT